MRYAMFGLWLAVSIAVAANADESAPGQPEVKAAEPPVAESQETVEEEADAEIRQIEEGVSGAEDIEEFVPTKPLSADKAIALPSDI
jgi:hypothetical protein